MPDQLEPLQLEPLHDEPLHELPDQEEPFQELPDQLEPFQVPPDQLEPAASSAAMAADTNGLPKMSCSPWSTTPFIEMWSEPRAASSDPVPVAGGLYCCEEATEGTEAPRRRLMSSSPQPSCFQLEEFSLSQVVVSICFT